MPDTAPRKVLSCASCRQRKVKCDKTQPVCTQCIRASLECVYPSRKPTRRLPRPRQSELLERISRLESIVGNADPSLLAQLDDSPGATGTVPREQPSSALRTEDKSPGGQQAGDAAARYMSGEFWSNLCAEVDGIKQALDQPSEDEDDEADDGSPEAMDSSSLQPPVGPSAFIFGNPGYSQREALPHPSRDTILRLWQIYLQNADPLMKFLHRPTLGPEIEAFARYPTQNPLTPPKEALLFAIYFAAVSTMAPEDCERKLGQTQDKLVAQFRMGVERALAAADYLNTLNMVTLQALTIYVTMIRLYSLSLPSWVLTPVVVRLAQAMNMHRDGDGRRFSPFEGEMRRRLWYFITSLDVRGAEDRGSVTVITSNSFNTVRPTNIDDDDFGPDSVGPLKPKPTAAENVICMCISQCTVFGHIIHPPDNMSGVGENSVYSEDELIKHVRKLETDFIHSADPSHLASSYASEIARMVILKLWLIVQYPFSAQPSVAPMRVSRVTMLRTAVSVMELSNRMEADPWRESFGWWTRCYVQWHPLAICLAELCLQTEGELVERAWALVERVYPLWGSTVADTAKGPLWRPIRKLYKKAKEARAGAMLKQLSISGQSHSPSALSSMTTPADLSGELDVNLMSCPASQAMPCSIDEFDSMNMDPSYLFQYPSELTGVVVDQATGAEMPLDMALWNEFLYDTQMNYSPGSGDST